MATNPAAGFEASPARFHQLLVPEPRLRQLGLVYRRKMKSEFKFLDYKTSPPSPTCDRLQLQLLSPSVCQPKPFSERGYGGYSSAPTASHSCVCVKKRWLASPAELTHIRPVITVRESFHKWFPESAMKETSKRFVLFFQHWCDSAAERAHAGLPAVLCFSPDNLQTSH